MRTILLAGLLAVAVLVGGRTARAADVNVSYRGLPADAQAAFAFGAAQVGAAIDSPVPICILATWVDDGPNGFLASGIATGWRLAPLPALPNVLYPRALANKLAGSDLDPSDCDVRVDINYRYPWYLGTDGHPSGGQYDLVQTAMHEILHGLGLESSIHGSSGSLTHGQDRLPRIYDLFATYQLAIGRTVYYDPLFGQEFVTDSALLQRKVTSGRCYWSGPLARAANKGVRPRLSCPGTYFDGGNVSHLDDGAYPASSGNALMTSVQWPGEAIHTLGIARAMLADLGW